MKKLFALLLALAILLPCAAALVPAGAKADSMYIIPDSDTRLLTEAELWEYKYDTLLYAFNEIYARHGYKFETGSRCYNWFTQMPWYKPNQNENSKDHHATYSQCSTIENKNVDLIKEVRRKMRESGDLNPKGKGMPTPPAETVNRPRGFDFVNLQGGQKYAVYSAPSAGSYREDQGWMLMLYDANNSGQYRVGYIEIAKIKGKKPALDILGWDYSPVEVMVTTTLTDDPALTGRAMATLPAGTRVTYLSTMYNTEAWDYIETTVDGKTARGFVPSGTLSITGEDITEKDAGQGDG